MAVCCDLVFFLVVSGVDQAGGGFSNRRPVGVVFVRVAVVFVVVVFWCVVGRCCSFSRGGGVVVGGVALGRVGVVVVVVLPPLSPLFWFRWVIRRVRSSSREVCVACWCCS